MTALASQLFRDLHPDARLWSASSSVFRRRWGAIADELKVDRRQGTGLTPASLRAGGATAYYEACEDIERLRRRARWRKNDTVEIYVQEVAPHEFLSNLDVGKRNRIFAAVEFFEDVLSNVLACPPRDALTQEKVGDSAAATR